MKILPNVEIVDLALYFDSTLVIADVHIGYEEALNKQGILVPRLQFEEIVKKMERIFGILKNKNIKRIVVNGDLKHEFGTISEQEWRNTLKFIDLLAKHCEEIILIKGNHDTILGPIAKKRNVKVVDYYIVDSITQKPNKRKSIIKNSRMRVSSDIASEANFASHANSLTIDTKSKKTLITHGNKIPNKEVLKEVSTIIIGHEHPAVSLKEGPRIEQFKCYLKGKYKRRNLIVQPSFNTMIEGTNLLRDKILSPFLKQNLGNFDVYIVEDKVYEFGKLRGLRKR
ncbi:metallophosphoesterase [Candidatus Woesearchaeota archaeon]|nr:metallophosphoesterase [Candidatus Woesearchaeota archaeon]